jgi:hypothetical protein
VIDEKEYKRVYRSEQVGEDGHIGLDLRLAYPRPLTKNDDRAIEEAVRNLLTALHVEMRRVDPKYQGYKKEWLERADAIFRDANIGAIFVKEIPNGYCGDTCCPHLPWLLVTTKMGVIKVGWRKRVIHLEWTESIIDATAGSLFGATEQVTMAAEGKMIHAWSYEKATEYMKKLHEAYLAMPRTEA